MLDLNINSKWTLFLDRDGVINRRLLGAYVSSREEFTFEPHCLDALKLLASLFSRILVVTNQQGIGKDLMSETQLEAVHQYFLERVAETEGRIDGIYYCPELAAAKSSCRKPNSGMALQAQIDFPEIDFSRSIMVGDSISDMEFGQNLGMKTVFIEGKTEEEDRAKGLEVDARFSSLWDFACQLKKES